MASLERMKRTIFKLAGIKTITTLEIPADYIDKLDVGKGDGKWKGATKNGYLMEIPNKGKQILIHSRTGREWSFKDVPPEEDTQHGKGYALVESTELSKPIPVTTTRPSHPLGLFFRTIVTYHGRRRS